MLAEQIGGLLRSARQALGSTQREMARRAGVSHRLWAEVERGERPNVSLETALRMLGEVGMGVRLTGPSGASRELRHPAGHTAARAARAALRRATWQGRQLRLEQEGMEDAAVVRGEERLAAVAQVSAQAFAVTRARRGAASPDTLPRRSSARAPR